MPVSEAQRKANARWRSKNKYHLIKSKAEYYQKYCEEMKLRRKEYYIRNKEMVKAKANAHYHANKANIRLRFKTSQDQTLRSWIGIVPEITQCQMCERDILLFTNDHRKSIHFDHRHGGTEIIKSAPKHWLRSHLPTPENILIWQSCDFGKLCWQCNRFLPTKDRTKVIHNLMKYMGVTNG